MIDALRARNEWKFASVLPRADRGLAIAWWILLVSRGLLPAVFAMAMGWLVGTIQRGGDLTFPLGLVGVVFVLLQVLSPIHHVVGTNLGSRTSAWLYDQLTAACVGPPGMGHLEDPSTHERSDHGPRFRPRHQRAAAIYLDGLHRQRAGGDGGRPCLGGRARRLRVVGTFLAGGCMAGHALAVAQERASGATAIRKRFATPSAMPTTLIGSPSIRRPPRSFGSLDCPTGSSTGFASRRTIFADLLWKATRLRERPLIWSLLFVLAANIVVFWSLGSAAADGRLGLGRLVTFATAAVSTSMIAFGGLSWALDGAAAPAAAVLRLQPAMEKAGLPSHLGPQRPAAMPGREIRFRDVTFRYPHATEPVLAGFDLTIPAGSSLAIVGQNGAGKTTLAKLLCRLYDPQAGRDRGRRCRSARPRPRRLAARVTAVFQDFIRFELPLRDNVAPAGAPDDVIEAALAAGGRTWPRRARHHAGARLSRAVPSCPAASGSASRWRGPCVPVAQGAGVVLLDEPTAQLDVRGEAEIFDRILAATRHTTTILISHRFSTVRHADRICVLEHGKVVELGTHDELMAAGGRYRTMFELQASRFSDDGEEGAKLDVLD